MSKFLKNIKDLNAFQNAVQKCKNDVWVRKNDGSEEFNLKSTLSQYIALGKLAEDYGEEFEIFCSLEDESNLLKYFYEYKSA